MVGAELAGVVEGLRPELPGLRAVVADVAAWETPESPFREPSVSADDPGLILYSSGTTGRPKGVVHTHANLASSLRALQQCWRFTPDDVLVNVLPLFHIHGLSFATHLSLLTGSCMRVDESFHPRRTLDSADVIEIVPVVAGFELHARGAQIARGFVAPERSGEIAAALFDPRWLFLLGLPPLAVGTWAGLKVFGHLDEQKFRRVVLALLLLSGLSLVAFGR